MRRPWTCRSGRQPLGAALVAAPEVATEGFGATGQDVGDGAPVRWQHQRAMRRQMVGGKAAEDVRHLDHGGAAVSEADHQCVEHPSQRHAGRLGQVGVDGGRRDVGVAEQDLHDPRIDAMLEQPGRIAMGATRAP
jgi:hypothetical protein